MIKNYIFDFGNVLCQFYPRDFCALYINDEETITKVSDVVFDRLYWDRLDDGSITDDEVKRCILSRLPKNLGEIGCKIYDNWVYNLVAVEGMENLVCDLYTSGKSLYLISNISKGFSKNYHKVPWIKNLLSKFRGLVFSADIGKIKPQKEIYEYLIDKYSLNSGECIFIDDSSKNIKGAELVGIKGYLFDGDALKLRKYLGDL